jgi:hypothetical protein
MVRRRDVWESAGFKIFPEAQRLRIVDCRLFTEFYWLHTANYQAVCDPEIASKLPMKVNYYSLQIGKLHITWLDLWTKKIGMWIEWDDEKKVIGKLTFSDSDSRSCRKLGVDCH